MDLNEGVVDTEMTKILNGLNNLNDIYLKKYGGDSPEFNKYAKIKNDIIYKQLNPFFKKNKINEGKMDNLIESFDDFKANEAAIEIIVEANNEYLIKFGEYEVELSKSVVIVRKNGEMIKSAPVKSTFSAKDLNNLAQSYAKQLGLLKGTSFAKLIM